MGMHTVDMECGGCVAGRSWRFEWQIMVEVGAKTL